MEERKMEYKIVEWLDNNYRINVIENGKQIAWANFDKSGNLIKESPEYFGNSFPSDLKEKTDELIKALPVNELAGNDVYIRFNNLPKSGKSTNWATGNKECGVSAYESAYNVETGEYSCYGALQGAELSYLIQGADIYFITGEKCGTGSDGEPLLKNVKLLAQAKYNRETGGYKVK